MTDRRNRPAPPARNEGMQFTATSRHLLLCQKIMSCHLTIDVSARPAGRFGPTNASFPPIHGPLPATHERLPGTRGRFTGAREPFTAIHERFLPTHERFTSTREPFATIHERFPTTREPFAATRGCFASTHEPFAVAHACFAAAHEPFAAIHEPLPGAQERFTAATGRHPRPKVWLDAPFAFWQDHCTTLNALLLPCVCVALPGRPLYGLHPCRVPCPKRRSP